MRINTSTCLFADQGSCTRPERVCALVSGADLAVADSPLSARRRPAGRRRATRLVADRRAGSVIPGPVLS